MDSFIKFITSPEYQILKREFPITFKPVFIAFVAVCDDCIEDGTFHVTTGRIRGYCPEFSIEQINDVLFRMNEMGIIDSPQSLLYKHIKNMN